MGKRLIKDPAGLGSTEIAAALRESLVICVIRDAVVNKKVQKALEG
jgi:hypothetical protein